MTPPPAMSRNHDVPATAGRAPACEERCDLAGGCLDSEQRVRWVGPLPPATVRAHLPDVMDQMHFSAVQNSVAGLVRCDVGPGAVDCRILGRWPALQFAEPETVVSERRITRRWRITGGGLARPETALGTITFGWESAEDTANGIEQSLWAHVEGYPSRFLRNAARGRPSWLPGPVSALYARYHGIVTCRYLRRMAAWMMERALEESAKDENG